ncbi:MAG: histidine triad nucleotide-binding protein [Clostridia bacterium]|nr:histidine triad nucleotide-binding protein [Clostridia bacterium]MBO4428377.1 histidine triad nucleotide-binding protein [Clostridia bacterium]
MDFCLFCKIVDGSIPSKKAYEDDRILAFYDINPQAPVHILVVPKEHIPSVDGINEKNSSVVAYIFEKIPAIAKEAGITNGYRVISNCGDDACQSVHHLHFHILGGAQLADKMA